MRQNQGLYTITGIKGSSDALVFRGNVTNNYIKFAGNIWRIFQIDEDGNLWLILEDPIIQGTYYRDDYIITDEENAKTVLGYKINLAQEKLNDILVIQQVLKAYMELYLIKYQQNLQMYKDY